MTPTNGYINYDNSFSIKLSRFKLISKLLYNAKIINKASIDFILFCSKNNIKSIDAVKKFPLPSKSVEVLYSSHMLEHLDREEVLLFLKEARRVIASNGILRLAVPDIEKKIKQYINHGDADIFLESTRMCVSRPRTLVERIKILLVGTRHHQWMYDSKSLTKLLLIAGFNNPVVLNPGETNIIDSQPLNLYERIEESIYIEAFNP